jgi:hypothetical protein
LIASLLVEHFALEVASMIIGCALGMEEKMPTIPTIAYPT